MEGIKMETQVLETIENSWGGISDFFKFPKNESDYHEKVELMQSLLEKDYSDDHPLFVLINLLGEMIDKYEMEHFSEVRKTEIETQNLSSLELLRHLMNENHLKQIDLIDVFGSQGHVSDILRRKRELNLRHIKALGKKFNIDSKFFL